MPTNRPRISIFNRQRKIRLKTEPLHDFLQNLARHLGVNSDFSVVLVSDNGMRKYHRRFLGVDKSTDVLSFPDVPEQWEETAAYAGDVLISVETAGRQKKDDLLEELKLLSLHGLLHLLGYDHETDAGEMLCLEETLKKDFDLH